MRRIVVATNNLGKLKEFQNLFPKDCLLTLKDISYTKELEETGSTFAENALSKAKQVALETKEIVLADDSGLEVFALNGAPGIYSARYAKDHDTEANNALLLKNLEGVTDRRARFVCVLCLYFPNGKYSLAEGCCEGSITLKPQGTNGFGYDPYFYVPAFHKTMAELPLELKNKISHRAKAMEKLKESLYETSFD